MLVFIVSGQNAPIQAGYEIELPILVDYCLILLKLLSRIA